MDRRRPSWWDVITRTWLFGCTVFLVIFGVRLEHAVNNFQREGQERRNQTCVIFERQQITNVRLLQNTYDFLLGLTPAQRHDPLNRFIRKQLPQTEAEARLDPSPPYCDEPGAGLPEPDPKVPPRPPGI